tara:strand:- start:748 stop:1068 length:321 start_codon:yes stop_codon:yes gene_type:complete
MKKITLSVAALSLALTGFCSNPELNKKEEKTPTSKQLLYEIMITTEDIIGWVKEDEWNGRMMTSELAKLYVNALLEILSMTEDVAMEKSKEDFYSAYNCNNCDEID